MASLWSHLLLATIFSLTIANLHQLGISAVDSPQYTVVHSEPDYEIRLYRDIQWVSSLVRGTSSFNTSTKLGFHRIYQYIHGANANSTQLPMTAPVVTAITPGPQQASLYYYVKLFLYKGNIPAPNQGLDLELEKWKARCLAVRKFSGFAGDDNVKKEVDALATSLKIKQFFEGVVNGEDSATMVGYNGSYAVAQYNASRHLTGRVNEVWIDLTDRKIAAVCNV